MKSHEMVFTRQPSDAADLIERIEAALVQASRGRSPYLYTSNCLGETEARFYVVGDKRSITPIIARLNTEMRLAGRLAWG